MKSINLVTRFVALIIILSTLCLNSGCSLKSDDKLTPMTITLLKAGKADAIVVISGSHTLLIDTGEQDDGQKITQFLYSKNIKKIDAMIITHFDKDHVGGADTILEQIPVKTIYVPDYEGTNNEYADFIKAARNNYVTLQRLTKTISFKLGDANIIIEPPNSYDILDPSTDFDNNFSLITTIQHGENRMIFMGDAEKPRIRQWLADSHPEPCDFLKVPHHGIYNKALNELFKTLSPKYSVICSSEKNPAEFKTIELLQRFCKNIFETKDGTVTITSTGLDLDVHQN